MKIFFFWFFFIEFFCFQGYAKGWSNAIWPESSLGTFQLIANLGLIFFMFFLGIELDLDQIKKNWKTTIPIACASITVPGKYPHSFKKNYLQYLSSVGIGCLVALWFKQLNSGINTSEAAFILFVGKIKNEFVLMIKIFCFVNSIRFWFFGLSCSCYVIKCNRFIK
jgi:hypothetical protein